MKKGRTDQNLAKRKVPPGMEVDSRAKKLVPAVLPRRAERKAPVVTTESKGSSAKKVIPRTTGGGRQS